MVASLRIAIADDERYVREYFRELMPRLGHQVILAEGGRQLADQCRLLQPDLAITDVRLPDMDGIAVAAEVNRTRPTPFILVSGYCDAEVLARAEADHIVAYLVKPVKQLDLEAALSLGLSRWKRLQALSREAAGLRQSLEERKLIERAKGTVMARVGVPEAEAFRRLRKLSSNGNRKLVDIAQEVLTAEEIFHVLESC